MYFLCVLFFGFLISCWIFLGYSVFRRSSWGSLGVLCAPIGFSRRFRSNVKLPSIVIGYSMDAGCFFFGRRGDRGFPADVRWCLGWVFGMLVGVFDVSLTFS